MNPKRYARICQMMAMRQPDLTICLEEVHKPHNVSAVIRTADAVGIHQIHAIWPTEQLRTQLSSAAGSSTTTAPIGRHVSAGEKHSAGRGTAKAAFRRGIPVLAAVSRRKGLERPLIDKGKSSQVSHGGQLCKQQLHHQQGNKSH
ncbi:SpoU rRNA Methylase family protein [Xenorhabdus japonica]|uniref:SpoU rRNA Methylase family protein n=1 Tax=Xenorhabdus japonica TaxID=53341 RepID=A0A1I5D8W9_9GAMM|nr:SpoU rRNA Methylase family protein [Xenorhabdus japonica]